MGEKGSPNGPGAANWPDICTWSYFKTTICDNCCFHRLSTAGVATDFLAAKSVWTGGFGGNYDLMKSCHLHCSKQAYAQTHA